ncbi:FixG Ig-like domain-containing protein, partial [Saccharolobus sp.]
DGNANIALVPNNNNLQSQQGYFAQIQNNGELVINFGNVAPSSVETLTDVFYIVNNLNEPVSVTITVEGNTNNYGISVTPYSFTLQPGQANEVPISITLNVGGASPNTQLSFTITITANYMAAGSSGSGSGSGSGS